MTNFPLTKVAEVQPEQLGIMGQALVLLRKAQELLAAGQVPSEKINAAIQELQQFTQKAKSRPKSQQTTRPGRRTGVGIRLS